MKPILTIGITSYKRVNELERCIRSVTTKYNDKIEVIVSEDHSPLSDEIKKTVENLAKEAPFKLVFSPNEINLGYDMNLGSIIKKANGEYVFLISDDDAIIDGALDALIEKIMEDKKYGVYYAPFKYSENGVLDRNHKATIEIEAGENSAARYIYDSILFSGLVFKKAFVESIDSSRFKNLNYIQVYMFLTMLYKHGGYYFENPSILCIGDGENAYGISESSGGNKILANRKSVISNLEFNKTLIRVIKMFDEDNATRVFDSFAKQYSLHSYSGLSIARNEGKKYYKEYFKTLRGLDIKLSPIVYVYYCLLYIFGKKNCDRMLKYFRNRLKK